MKTPLITTHDIRGFLDPGVAWIHDNPATIRHAVDGLLRDGDRYRALQENGFLRYQENHTPESVGQRYSDFFARVLGNSHSAAGLGR